MPTWLLCAAAIIAALLLAAIIATVIYIRRVVRQVQCLMGRWF